MPVIGGVVEVLLVSAALVVAVIIWLRRDRRHRGPRLHGSDGIDREELEAAEREVRELDTAAGPDDERPGDDWGPGTARPRPRMRL